MRKAAIFVNNVKAAYLVELNKYSYEVQYLEKYKGPPISLTISTEQRIHTFAQFPPFFEGLLPEGLMLESLLRRKKIDRDDFLSQLIAVGEDLVGSITVQSSHE